MARILVVDDELGIRALLSEILSDEGHQTELAENAEQARSALKQFQPDLVLLDIWMPDTDGITLLKEWAQQGQLTMPVIVMSGHATMETAMQATRIGAMAFLEKPIAMQRLLKVVQQALALARTQAKEAAHASGAAAAPKGEGDARTAAELAALGNWQALFTLPLREARDAFDKAYFEYHLEREGSSIARLSHTAGLERTNLYRKIKQLGIDFRKYRRRERGLD